jgi:RNA polymerase primary sigma factor
VAEAIAASPLAGRELRQIAAELRDGALRAQDVLRNAAGSAGEPNARALAAKLEGGAWVELRPEAWVVDRIARAVARGKGAADREAGATLAAIAHERAVSRVAMARLVESHLPLVFSTAARAARRRHQVHDLVQEGNIALMRAAEKFDYRRGFRFGTYAEWWIKQAVDRALAAEEMVHVPEYLLERQAKVLRRRHAAGGEREGAMAEPLAPGSRLSPDALQNVLYRVTQPSSLDAPVGAEGDATLADRLADVRSPPADAVLSAKRLRAELRDLLDGLSPREQQVLRARFGLDGAGEQTLDEVGSVLSISRERVRQIEEGALRKLRDRSGARELRSYLG